MKKYYLLLIVCLLGLNMFGQSPWIVPYYDSTDPNTNNKPLCASNLEVPRTSPAGGPGVGNMGSVGCLGSTPNPNWFFIPVGVGGNITLNLSQTSAATGAGIDIDFIVWGPFSSRDAATVAVQNNRNLNQVDCSYSPSATETIEIPNAPAGSFYLLLVTNFNGSAGSYTMTQQVTPGMGYTDCSCILNITGDNLICRQGGTATLTGTLTSYNDNFNTVASNQWQWSGPSGDIPGANGRTITVTAPGTYTLRVRNDYCRDFVSQSFTVSPVTFPVQAPTDLTACADPALPYAFNLAQNTPHILNGEAPGDYDIYYYASYQDALNGFPFITNENAYSAMNGTQIWVSVQNGFSPYGCIDYYSFVLHVDAFPTIGTLPKVFACDPDHDGIETVDLTVQNPAVLGGRSASGYTITYYLNQIDALAGVNAIANPQAYVTGTATYYVRLVNNSNPACFDTASFGVEIIDKPVTTAPANASVCSNAPYILPPLSVGAYYNQPGGAGTAVAAGTPISTTTTMYVYAANYGYAPDGTTRLFTCDDQKSFTIQVSQSPVIAATVPMYAEDADRNGREIVDLTTQESSILGGVNPNTVVITYHLSQNDADNDTAAIVNPQSYNAATGTIYVRVESAANPACYSVGSFYVNIVEKPQVTAPANQSICSDQSYILPALTVGNYYSQPNGAGTQYPAGAAITTTSTIYVYSANNVYAADGTTVLFSSTDQKSFTVNVVQKPSVEIRQDVDACPTYILPGLSVGTYRTAAGGAGIQLYPGDIITRSRTIYIYAANTDGVVTCTDESSFRVNILTAPALGAVTNMETCDDPSNDGTDVFNLTIAGTQAINGQSGLSASYYTSASNANSSASPIANPAAYRNTTPGTQTIYIRVENTTGCYSVAPLTLTVHPKPLVPVLNDFVKCDDTAPAKDGKEIFNLTSRVADITTDATDTVTFFLSNTDAQLNQNPITNPSAFMNTVPDTQTVYIRRETQFGCWDTGSLKLIVNPLPDANLTVPVFTSCEEVPGQGYFNLNTITPVITNGQGGYTVAYYVNQSDALAGNANFLDVSVPYLSSDATLYVLVKDAVTGCSIVVSTLLDVQSAPIIPAFPALEECDFNNDNVASFNLQALIDQVVAYFGTGVTISLHETSEDANFQQGVNPITNLTAYTNVRANTTNGVQTIYIRVSNTAGCYDVSQAQLIVHPVPVAQDPLEAYHMCDNGVSDTDGQAIFDLTSYNTTVLNGMNAAAFPVSYYASQGDAVAGTNAIPNPATYQSATATVYVRVTNNTTQCYDLVALELVVDPLPVVVQPSPLTQCDINNPGDEKEVFDLTGKITEITTGVNGVNVSFYHTYADALAGSNAIANPAAYTNTVNNGVESIFVRVSNAETGCYRIVILDIRVAPLPVLTMPTPDQLTVCDTNGSGYGSFDLTSLENIMINNGVNLSLTFYQTAYDAANNLNAIQNPAGYTNLNPGVQFVYVVATDATSGCRSQVYTLTLNVSPAPRTVRLNDLTLCDDQDNNGQDNQRVFDLTVQDAAIATQLGVAPGTYTIHYFTTEANALAGAPRITAPQVFMATADGQQIWVRIENSSTDCYQTGSFALRINQPQALAPASMFTKCNDGAVNNQTAVFNLTTKNDYILTPFGIGEGNVVTYYASAADYAANTPIATPETYSNTSNPQVLFVKVTTPQGCISRSFLTLRVLPQPTPNTTPEALEVCDTNANSYGFEQFNLKNASRRILDNDSNAVISYYETQADALAGTNAIAVTATGDIPYVNTTAWSQTVYARVALAGSEVADPSCVQVVEQVLTVNPMPPIYDPATGNVPNYAICTPNSSGFESFRLMEFVRGVITNAGGNPNDYDIRFYRDNAAYAAGTALPHVYTNTTPNQQTILVYARNFATGCDILTNLTLFADQAAVAHAAASNPWMVCDDDGTNDGMHSFDLTQQDASILAGQSTTMFKVEYYTTQAAALAADTTSPDYIANPAAFVNTSNPQTIWATVKNYLSATPCIDVTSFEVGVELLGEPVISTPGDNHTLCMEYNGGAINPLPLTVNLASGSYTFTWYRDGVEVARDLTATQYNATEPGLYTVIATSTTALGCISEPSATFEVIQSGPAQAIDPNQPYVISAAFSADQTITVLAQGYGEYQYSLGPDGPWQNSNVFTNVPLGYFDIYVRDTKTDNPCTDYVIEGVSIIDYPKFFTPNGDGYNDYWNIQGMTNSGYETARILIYDRYGKLIKQLNPLSRTDQGQGWDGTYNGHPLPSDDYWFTVEFTENGQTREFRAHFALKR